MLTFFFSLVQYLRGGVKYTIIFIGDTCIKQLDYLINFLFKISTFFKAILKFLKGCDIFETKGRHPDRPSPPQRKIKRAAGPTSKLIASFMTQLNESKFESGCPKKYRSRPNKPFWIKLAQPTKTKPMIQPMQSLLE